MENQTILENFDDFEIVDNKQVIEAVFYRLSYFLVPLNLLKGYWPEVLRLVTRFLNFWYGQTLESGNALPLTLKEARIAQFQRITEEMRRKNEIQTVLEIKLSNEIVKNNWTNRLNKLRSCCNSKVEKNQILEKIEFLESEKSEMRRMYEETGKTFLLDIEESIEEILEEFRRLAYVLENEPSNKSRIQDCSSALSKLTLAIPTLAELKKRYNEDNDF
ncbi:unnamed protein product [Caenorhabditis nigoni]